MNDVKAYKGIDLFRIAAALLVVAIHTSPLAGISTVGDFILTRILARAAVPFFITASGFFLFTGKGALKGFVKKTSLIYAAAVILYIPLNIYNGYFSMEMLLPNIIKDIIFDGTAYHLWYLPASIIGAAIAWHAVKRFGLKAAFFITAALYCAGLLGDSYYAVAQGAFPLKELYGYIFTVTDYTRNGIFFTPVFFVLGGIIAHRRGRVSLKASIAGLSVSLVLMLCEGLLVRHFQLSRHDSMYIFLIPCTYFLFCALSHWRGRRSAYLSRAALIIYIIHPMVIVVVRMLAKTAGAQKLLIDNSAVHFLAVSAVSCAIAAVLSIMLLKAERHSAATIEAPRAWIELNLTSLENNVFALKSAMHSGCELMAVVKANAYGHGAVEISKHLSLIGVNAYACAVIDEGIELRKFGIQGEILILGQTSPERAAELRRFRLTQTLTDYSYAKSLSSRGCKLKAHIKIDTGMHRLGFNSDDTLAVIGAFALKNIEISGIYTHLSDAVSLSAKSEEFTLLQIGRFYGLLTRLKQNGIKIPKVHIQSSYGLLNYPQLKCSYVRAGVAMYGVLSTPEDKTRLQLDLRPVLALKAKVVLIKRLKRGEAAGYDNAFTAQRDSTIAVISIGYADGVPRSLTHKGAKVLINGELAPIAGRICMDCLLADVTDIKSIAAGDIATLIGKDGRTEITAAETAQRCGTISNELLSRLGSRLEIKAVY